MYVRELGRNVPLVVSASRQPVSFDSLNAKGFGY